MNRILIITIFVTMACSTINKNKEANEDFVVICKSSMDSIKIDYMDSMCGISNIKEQLENDTLNLKIYVSKYVKQRTFEIKIPKVKYLKVGNKLFDLANIDYCKKTYSGEDALEQLKKQIND